MGSDKETTEESEPIQKADSKLKSMAALMIDARALVLATAALGSLGLTLVNHGTSNNEVKVNATYEAMREQIVTLRERVAKLEALTEEHLGRPVRQPRRHHAAADMGFGSGAGVDFDGVGDVAPMMEAPAAASPTQPEEEEAEEATPELPMDLDSLVQQKAAK